MSLKLFLLSVCQLKLWLDVLLGVYLIERHFLRFILFLFVRVLPACIYVQLECINPMEVRRAHWVLQNLSYGVLGTIM